MRIYQVSYRAKENNPLDGGDHQGYSYHSSKKSARRAIAKAHSDGMDAELRLQQMVDGRIGVRTLLRLLNTFGAHNDNG